MSRSLLQTVRGGTRLQKAVFVYSFVFVCCTLLFLLFTPWWDSVRTALGAALAVALVDLASVVVERRRRACR